MARVRAPSDPTWLATLEQAEAQGLRVVRLDSAVVPLAANSSTNTDAAPRYQ